MRFALWDQRIVFRAGFYVLLLADLVVLGLVAVPEAIAQYGCVECHRDEICDDGDQGDTDDTNGGECVPISGKFQCEDNGSGCMSYLGGCSILYKLDYPTFECVIESGECGINYCEDSSGE